MPSTSSARSSAATSPASNREGGSLAQGARFRESLAQGARFRESLAQGARFRGSLAEGARFRAPARPGGSLTRLRRARSVSARNRELFALIPAALLISAGF